MDSIKNLLKTDDFSEIINNKKQVDMVKGYLIKSLGDKNIRVSIRSNILLICFSNNNSFSKLKINKINILKDINDQQNDFIFSDIHLKIDPSLNKKNKVNKKKYKSLDSYWINLQNKLEKSPLKEYLSSKDD